MAQWEYCEVGYTPKQITIHVYSSRAQGSGCYEAALPIEEWGALLAQLGDDEWEMVSAVSAATKHTLYYFKRTIDEPVASQKQQRANLYT